MTIDVWDRAHSYILDESPTNVNKKGLPRQTDTKRPDLRGQFHSFDEYCRAKWGKCIQEINQLGRIMGRASGKENTSQDISRILAPYEKVSVKNGP